MFLKKGEVWRVVRETIYNCSNIAIPYMYSFLIQNLKLLNSENPKFALIRLLHDFLDFV